MGRSLVFLSIERKCVNRHILRTLIPISRYYRFSLAFNLLGISVSFIFPVLTLIVARIADP